MLQSFKFRSFAFLCHLLGGGLFLLTTVFLFAHLWFPGAFLHFQGGFDVAKLMLMVDVVLGPVLTFVLFNPKKPRSERLRDLALVVCLQLIGFGYGLWVFAGVRPVALAFEQDRFVSVGANEVKLDELPKALPGLTSLPWTGPRLLGTRQSRPDEVVTGVDLALRGFDHSQRPTYWTPYDAVRQAVRTCARPLTPQLLARYRSDGHAADFAQGAAAAETPSGYLWMQAREQSWIVVLSARASVLGFVETPSSQGVEVGCKPAAKVPPNAAAAKR